MLGLQELVVVGMADGYAQAQGRPTHVNLHTAPGVGNAVGGIFNAQANKSPLLITAGQQVRAQITIEANLTNRDAVLGPQPYVKWAHEPPRAQSTCRARSRGRSTTRRCRRAARRSSRSRWTTGTSRPTRTCTRNATARSVVGSRVPDPTALAELAERSTRARNPVLVAGPDIDASGGWDAGGRARESQQPARLGDAGSRAAAGSASPRTTRASAACCRRRSAPLSETLAGHDLVLVVGSSVFPYYPYIPGPLLPEGAALVAITCDPSEAARAPMGDAIVGDVGARARAAARAGRLESERRARPSRARRRASPSRRPNRSAARRRWPRSPRRGPRTGSRCSRRPSSTVALRNRLRLSQPGSYYFSASGGLGFGISAAVGVQLAQPERPVVCVLGEGSAQYGITALWTAAAYRVPVTFLVLRNEEYMILKWFARVRAGQRGPRARPAGPRRGRGRGGLRGAVADRSAARGADRGAARRRSPREDGPRLVQVPVATGMWLTE